MTKDEVNAALKTWVEVENTYLTNQPTLLRPVGRGRGRRYERIPDPDRPPTEAYLWAWQCTRTTRGVNRRRYLHTLRASSEKELDAQLVELFKRNDVILIAEQGPEYASYRGDPAEMARINAARNEGLSRL